HIPTYMVSLINQWRHTISELESTLGRTPSVEEMAEIMQVPLRKAKVIHRVVDVLSAAAESYGGEEVDEDQMLETVLEDQNAGRPEDAMVAREEKAKAIRLLDEIDPREADILRLHYGLDGKNPMSLKEIGKKMGLTRERIRQLRRDALTKLYECMICD
ncbi:MAG: sigma-70 family RNA polymerase sigma factor, partial [Phycisphaerales bacterium]